MVSLKICDHFFDRFMSYCIPTFLHPYSKLFDGLASLGEWFSRIRAMQNSLANDTAAREFHRSVAFRSTQRCAVENRNNELFEDPNEWAENAIAGTET